MRQNQTNFFTECLKCLYHVKNFYEVQACTNYPKFQRTYHKSRFKSTQQVKKDRIKKWLKTHKLAPIYKIILDVKKKKHRIRTLIGKTNLLNKLGESFSNKPKIIWYILKILNIIKASKYFRISHKVQI